MNFLRALFHRPQPVTKPPARPAWYPHGIDREPPLGAPQYEAQYDAWLLRQQTRITTAFDVDIIAHCLSDFSSPHVDDVPRCPPETCKYCDELPTEPVGNSFHMKPTTIGEQSIPEHQRLMRSLRETDAEPRRIDVTYDGKPWPPLTHMVVTVACAHCGNIERPCKCDRIRYGVTPATMAMDLVEIDWQSEGFNFLSELRAENKKRSN